LQRSGAPAPLPPPRHYPARPSRPAVQVGLVQVSACRSAGARERLARLEERLHRAQHGHPADAGDTRCRLRRPLESVVGEGHEARAAALRDDLPRHAARRLPGALLVVGGIPLVHESPWWIELEYGGNAPILTTGADGGAGRG